VVRDSGLEEFRAGIFSKVDEIRFSGNEIDRLTGCDDHQDQ